MPRLTLTHIELFHLWEHAAHVARAPQYEIERADDGRLYLIRHDRDRIHLSPVPRPSVSPTEGSTHAHP